MESLHQIFSAAVILLLVMDPAGNLPVFSALLKAESAAHARRIILRESLFALVILLFFLLFGDVLLKLLQVSQSSLKIAGGLILLLIALKMIFGAPVVDETRRSGRMLLVPLAIPLIAGPSAIATVVLLHGTLPLGLAGAALALAWFASTAILLTGRNVVQWCGKPFMEALESLMGFILAMVSVEMLISGIKIVWQLP